MEHLVPRHKRAALMLHRVPREGTKRRYLTYDFSAKGLVGRAALIRLLSHATASQFAVATAAAPAAAAAAAAAAAVRKGGCTRL
jgi:transcription elongation factor